MDKNIQQAISTIYLNEKQINFIHFYDFKISINEYKAINYFIKNFTNLSDPQLLNESKKKLKIKKENKINIIKYFTIAYYLICLDIQSHKEQEDKELIKRSEKLLNLFEFSYIKLYRDNIIDINDTFFLSNFLLNLGVESHENQTNDNIISIIYINLSLKMIEEIFNNNNDIDIIMDKSQLGLLNEYFIIFYNKILKNNNNLNIHILTRNDQFSKRIFNFINILILFKECEGFEDLYNNYFQILISCYKFHFNYKIIMSTFVEQIKSVITNVDTKTINDLMNNCIVSNFSIDYLNKVDSLELSIKNLDKLLLDSGFYMSNNKGGLSAKIPIDLKEEFTLIFGFKCISKYINNQTVANKNEFFEILTLYADNKVQFRIEVIQSYQDEKYYLSFYSDSKSKTKSSYNSKKQENANKINPKFEILLDQTYIFYLDFDKNSNITVYYQVKYDCKKYSYELRRQINTKDMTVYYGCDKDYNNKFNGYLGSLIILKYKPRKESFIKNIFKLQENYPLVTQMYTFDFSYFEKYYGLENYDFIQGSNYFQRDQLKETADFIKDVVLIISQNAFYNFSYYGKKENDMFGYDGNKYFINGNYCGGINYNFNNINYALELGCKFDNYFHIFKNKFTLLELVKYDGIYFFSFQFEYYFQILTRIFDLLGKEKWNEYNQNVLNIEKDFQTNLLVVSVGNKCKEEYDKKESQLSPEEMKKLGKIVEKCLHNNLQLIILLKNMLRYMRTQHFEKEIRKMFYEMKYTISKLCELCEIFDLSISELFTQLYYILLDFQGMAFDSLTDGVCTSRANSQNEIRNEFLEVLLNIKANPLGRDFKVLDSLLDLMKASIDWKPSLPIKNLKNLLEKFCKFTNIVNYRETKKDFVDKFIKILANTLCHLNEFKGEFENFDSLFNKYPDLYLQFFENLYIYDYSNNLVNEQRKFLLHFLFKRLQAYSIELGLTKEQSEKINYLFLLIIIELCNFDIKNNISIKFLSKNFKTLHSIIRDSELNISTIRCILASFSSLTKEQKVEHIYIQSKLDTTLYDVVAKIDENNDINNKYLNFVISLLEDCVYLFTKNIYKVKKLQLNISTNSNEDMELLEYFEKSYDLLYTNLINICRNIMKKENLAKKLLSHKINLLNDLFYYRFKISSQKIKNELLSMINLAIYWKKNSFIYNFINRISNELIAANPSENLISVCLTNISVFLKGVINNANLSSNMVSDKKMIKKWYYNLISIIAVISTIMKEQKSIFNNMEIIKILMEVVDKNKILFSEKMISLRISNDSNTGNNTYLKPLVEIIFDLLVLAYVHTNNTQYIILLNRYFVKPKDKNTDINYLDLSVNNNNFNNTIFLTYSSEYKKNSYLDETVFSKEESFEKYMYNIHLYFFIKACLYYFYGNLNKDEFLSKQMKSLLFIIYHNCAFFDKKKWKKSKKYVDPPSSSGNRTNSIDNAELNEETKIFNYVLNQFAQNPQNNMDLFLNEFIYFVSSLLTSKEDIFDYSYYLIMSTSVNKNIDIAAMKKNISKDSDEEVLEHSMSNKHSTQKSFTEERKESDSYSNSNDTTEKLKYKSKSEQIYPVKNSSSVNGSFTESNEYKKNMNMNTNHSNETPTGPKNNQKYLHSSMTLSESMFVKKNMNINENFDSISNDFDNVNNSNSNNNSNVGYGTLFEDTEIKLQSKNFQPFVILCGENKIQRRKSSLSKENDDVDIDLSKLNVDKDLNYKILSPKNEFLLVNFGLVFKDIFFNNELFKKVILAFYSKYQFINYSSTTGNMIEKLVSLDLKSIPYPSKIKNYSNSLDPPLFINQDFNFFENKTFLKITHNYFLPYLEKLSKEKKLVNKKFNFYKKMPEQFTCEEECKFYAEYISPNTNLLGELFITQNDYLFFISIDREKENISHDYNNTTYIFSDLSIKHSFKDKIIYIYYSQIKEIIIRRYLLMWQAIEIYLSNGKSYFFNLFRNHFMIKFVDLLLPYLKHPVKKNIKDYFFKTQRYLNKWKDNEISTYDFLLYINKYAARSYNDSNQYPVFPWILQKYRDINNDDVYYGSIPSYNSKKSSSNLINNIRRGSSANTITTITNMGEEKKSMVPKYSSKNALLSPVNERLTANNKQEYFFPYRIMKYPIPAQTLEKRETLIYKYEDSFSKFKVHFGTHYSTSAYVYFYLMRQNPYTHNLIKLQNYSQENPNRMLNNLDETIDIIYNSGECREIIPEFFCKPEFLLNFNCVEFGYRKKKSIVDDLKLRKKNIAEYIHFIINHRRILNNNDIKKSICDWINYIFGKNQITNEAKTCNTFIKSSYAEKFNLEQKLENFKRKKLKFNTTEEKKKVYKLIKNKIVLNISFGSTPYKLFDDELVYYNPVSTKEYETNLLDYVSTSFKYFHPKVCSLTTRFYSFKLDDHDTKNEYLYTINEKMLFCRNYMSKDYSNVKIKEKELITKMNSFLSNNPLLYKAQKEQNIENNIENFINLQLQNVHNSYIILYHPIINENIYITCKHLTKSIKISCPLKSDLNFDIYVGEYVTCIEKGNTEEEIFYIGMSSGKIFEWKIFQSTPDPSTFRCMPVKHVMAHLGRVNTICYNKRLKIIISSGEDGYIYIRKCFDYELLSAIKIKESLLVVNLKVSDLNLIYAMCYSKKYNKENEERKPFILLGYTLSGILFAKSTYDFYNNFCFTKCGNVIVGNYLTNELMFLKGCNLDCITCKDFGMESMGCDKMLWFDYSTENEDDKDVHFFTVIYFTFENNKLFIKYVSEKDEEKLME